MMSQAPEPDKCLLRAQAATYLQEDSAIILHGVRPTFQQECFTRNIKTALRLSMHSVCVCVCARKRTCVYSHHIHINYYTVWETSIPSHMLPCLNLKQWMNSAPQASWHSPIRQLCPIWYFLSKIRICFFNCEVVKHEQSLQVPAVLGDNSHCQPHALPIWFLRYCWK